MYDLRLGDCLEVMAGIPDGSVDLVLCDLPYGTTACKWDSVIPFEPLWAQYRRIAKKNAAIVLTASQPFTTALIASSMREFKYSWVWRKSNASGFANAKKRPLKICEDVCVFSCGMPPYQPQGLERLIKPRERKAKVGEAVGGNGFYDGYLQEWTNYPKNILEFQSDRGHHPTQKPVALMEYLIRTYTNEGETVLDNCMGSGTTGVACANTGRRFIGIERDPGYFEIARSRIEQAHQAQVA